MLKPRRAALPLRLATLLFAALLPACAGPPTAAPGQILGYGTPGVESFAPPGTTLTLADLRSRCSAVPDTGAPPRPQTLDAACDQLRRTVRNQPGNTVAAAPR